MESNQHEDSKSSSSEETERSDQTNDEMGTGRSYECVYCKRGFTTAQALGGHMNIHRKDRANKSRPSLVPSNSSKVDEEYASFRAYTPIQSDPPHYPTSHHHEVHVNYQTFFPASTWGFGPSSYAQQHSDDLYVQSPQHLNPFGEDWRSSLSLQIGPSSHVDHNNKEKREDGNEADDELDLELRLGHHDP